RFKICEVSHDRSSGGTFLLSPTRKRGTLQPRLRVGLRRLLATSLCRDSRLGQMGSRQLDQLVKRGGIVNGDVGQCLAIQLDQCSLETGDELAVAQAAHTTGGVDANDPQATEFALADAPVAVGIDPGADESDDRLP